MSSFNQVTLIGHAGKDADMSYTTSGKAVTKFSLAVNDYVGKDTSGSTRYNTQWFNIVAWNGLAEIANKIVEKGKCFLVQGRLDIRKYTGRDGKEYTSVDVVAEKVTPLTPKSSGSSYNNDLDDALGQLDDHAF